MSRAKPPAASHASTDATVVTIMPAEGSDPDAGRNGHAAGAVATVIRRHAEEQ